MAEAVLVCVGLADGDPFPEGLQDLIATGYFGQQLRISVERTQPDRYWCSILGALSDQCETALVVAAEADCTSDLLRLRALLHTQTAAVLPLTVLNEAARPLMQPEEKLQLSAKSLNTWLNRYAVGKPVELPMLAGSCAWLNVQALKPLEAANDAALSAALRRRGLSILLSDEAFVDDSACLYTDRALEGFAEPITVALRERHPYTALRHPLSQLNDRNTQPPKILERGPGAVLHISHSWGGGLERWIGDFHAADDASVHLILKSVGIREAPAQALALHVGQDPVPIKQWSLTTPFQSTSLGSYEYRQILQEIQSAFDLSCVMVSTLIGHSLDLYDVDVPIVQVLHDYYPWCPPLYATWKTPCTHCDASRLQSCLKQNPAHEFFGAEQGDWLLTLRDRFLDKIKERRVQLVAPTQSVKSRWQQLAPPLADFPIIVIPHGLPAATLSAFSAHQWQASPDQQLHLLVLGTLFEHKGLETLKRLLPELSSSYRITLLGAGDKSDELPQYPGLTIIKRYLLPDLPSTLQRIKPDIGLLLSTVPETFSYTLSELYAAGIPPIATRLGAFSDRIEDGSDGWLVSPSGDDLLTLLSRLNDNRGLLASVRENVKTRPQRSTDDMMAEYRALLPDLTPVVSRRPLHMSVLAGSEVPLNGGVSSRNAVYVKPSAPYRLALYQFLMYSYQKCRQSPRLPGLVRALLGGLLRVVMRMIRPKAP